MTLNAPSGPILPRYRWPENILMSDTLQPDGLEELLQRCRQNGTRELAVG